MRRDEGRRRRCGVRPILEQLEDRTLPAAYTVDSVAQLIAAVGAANTAGGANTLTLTAAPSFPYVLTAALPDIAANDDLTIIGNADTIERGEDAPKFGLLTVARGASLTLQELTLTGGQSPDGASGGAINNQGGTVTVQECVITGNSASGSSQGGGGGGIANSQGTVTVSDSTITGNHTDTFGGGIWTQTTGVASLTVTRCTISGNSATLGGGGIADQGGAATVSFSTINGNSAGSLPPGSVTAGFPAEGGGGLLTVGSAGPLTVSDSTIAGNSSQAGGGGLANHSVSRPRPSATLVVADCTIAGNANSVGGSGGGIGGAGRFTSLRNTILADNTDTSPTGGQPDLAGSLIDLGYNLIGSVASSTGLSATDLLNVDPALGALQDNGGPTFTMALLPGSLAINAGNPRESAGSGTTPLYDQRGPGHTRVFGGAIDIGAFEVQPPLPSFVVGGFPTSVASGDTGDTITVTALNGDGSTDTTYGGTVHFKSSDPFAVLPADATLPGGSGTFSVILKTAGTQSITATDAADAAITGTETGISVVPSAPARLRFLQVPSGAMAGTALGTFTVAVTDAAGNIVTGDNSDTISLTVSGPGPLVAGTTTATAVNGIAAFPGLTFDKAGGYTFAAAVAGLTGDTSGSVSVAPDVATSLAFTPVPTGGPAGQPLDTVQVALVDRFGNTETGDNSDSVGLAVSGPDDFVTNPVAVANGVASFPDLILDVAGTYTLTAAASGFPRAAPVSFDVGPGPATHLAFTQAPTGGTAGQPLDTIQVSVTDDFTNVVPDAGGTVSLALVGPGDFTTDSVATADVVNGVATFANLALDAPGHYTIQASSSDVPEIGSLSLAVLPVVPTQPGGSPLAAAVPLTFTATNSGRAGGFLARPLQVDMYAVGLGAGDEISVTASGQAVGSGLAPLLRIFDATGTPVALDDQQGGDPQLTFQAATAGDYYIGVSTAPNDNYDPTVTDSGTPGTTTGLYTLNIRLTPGAAPQPNVVPSSVRVGTTTAAWGDQIPVSFTVENRGAADAGSFSVVVALAADTGVQAPSGFPFPTTPDVLDTVAVPGLAAGQAYSSGVIDVTLPDVNTAQMNFLPTSGPVFLEVQVVPDGSLPDFDPQTNPGRLHRGEDWQDFTVVSDATASGTNLSAATADGISDTLNNSRISGTLAPGQEQWYQLTSEGAQLTATVTGQGGAPTPQLILYGPDQQILDQSNEVALGAGAATIAQHLQSGTYYLGVVARGAGGSYQLITESLPAKPPSQPLVSGTVSQSAGGGGPGSASSVLVADITGSGRPGIVAGTPNGLQILRGNGDATFLPLVTSAGQAAQLPSALALAAADLTGNGRLDVIAADAGGNLDVLLASAGDFQTGGFAVGHIPAALAMADLNGDGYPDAVTANADGTVTVLLANGGGGFQAAQDVSVNSWSNELPPFVAVADVNGDGRPDIIVPGPNGTAQVLLGNGDGTFAPPLEVPVGQGLVALAAADLNGDGRIDLVATTYDPGTATGAVRVLLNNGDGTFRRGQVIPTGTGRLDAITAADVNGDGRPDVIAAGDGTGIVLLGNGDGTFAPPLSFPVAAAAPLSIPIPITSTSLAVADVNGDGRPDLVIDTIDFLGGSFAVTVLPGNGDGTFLSGSPLSALGLKAESVADLNGDDHPDLVGTTSTGVVVALGNGDGNFQTAHLVAPGQELVAVTDLNGDGRPDLVLSGGVMLGNGDGTFQPLDRLPTGETALALGDFTPGGPPDLVVKKADGLLSLRPYNSDGEFGKAQALDIGDHAQFVTVADLNNDGLPDLVVNGNTTTVLLNNGDGTFRSAETLQFGSSQAPLIAADFDGSGLPYLVASYGFAFDEDVLPNNGDGTFNPTGTPIFFTSQDVIALAVADVTGHLDVLTVNTDGTILLQPGNGDGTFQSPQTVGVYPGVRSLTAADLTGGGRMDLVTNEGVLLSNGDGTFRPAPQGGGILPRNTPHLADLTGDGIADSVVLDRSGNVLYRKGLGDGQFAAPVVLNPDHPAVDLAVVNTGGGWAVAAADANPDPTAVAQGNFLYDISLYTVAADGTVTRAVAFQAGQPARLAAGDLTGSGLDDLVAADAIANSVTIALQTAPGQFGSVVTKSVGVEPSDIALTDVNGDGLPDVVVSDQGGGAVTVLFNDATQSFATQSTFRTGLGPLDAVTPTTNNGSGPPGSGPGTPPDSGGGSDGLPPGFPGTPPDFPGGPPGSPGSPPGDGNGSGGGQPTSATLSSLEQPAGLVAGDFTGHGRNDLIVLNRGSDSFSVLANDGNGGFANPQADLTTSTSDGLAVNVQPGPIVAGHFHGQDQPLDLAVLMPQSAQVWIYTGDGHGHFTHTASVPAGDPPTGLSVVPGSAPGLHDLLVGNDFGDVLRLVGDGHGSFSPTPVPADRVALDVLDPGNGKPVVLVANQQTNRVTVQAPAAGAGFTPIRALTAADSAAQLAPGAVQWAKLDQNSPFYDAVVIGSGSNDVLIYRGTGFDAAGRPTFAAPVTYAVGTDPVAVTIQDITGDGIPDMLVANHGSNDVSVLFGSRGASGNWVARPGPRLKSWGAGPVSVAVQDVNGTADLVITNGQSGNLTVLPGVGQGFFNDTNPQILDVPGNPALAAALLLGSSGLVTTADGQLVGFNLDNFAGTVATVFAPPPGEGVVAVAALADGDLVAAEQDGNVVLLAESAGSALQVVQTLAPLTGIPSDPSALAVLEGASGGEVLVTSAGQDQLFVFGLPAGLTLPALTPGAPVAVATVPSEAPLALVVTLQGGILPGGESTPAAAPGADGTAGGVGGGEEVATVQSSGLSQIIAALVFLVGDVPGDGAPARDSDFGDSIDDRLRRIDLYRPPDDLTPKAPAPRDKVIHEDDAGPVPPQPAGNPAAPPEPVHDAAWLDWPPSPARRGAADHPQAGDETSAPFWGQTLLTAAAVSGLALWAERRRRRDPGRLR